MPDLTEEEKRILRQAYEIKERIKAEELEAGEMSVDEAVDEELSTDQPIQRQRKQTRPKPNTANVTLPASVTGEEADTVYGLNDVLRVVSGDLYINVAEIASTYGELLGSDISSMLPM